MHHFGVVFVFTRLQRKIAIFVVDLCVFGRAAPEFFRDFGFSGGFRHKTAKISSGLRCSMSPGHILSLFGAKSLPIFLMLGILNGGPRVYASVTKV